ncbi:MAG: OmpA family protein [Saprospirales bacterium]|nr:OmpA family protein [Saprospirales bacterium]
MRTLPFLFLLLLIPLLLPAQKIKDGQLAFERKQYDVATQLLEKEYNKEKSRVERGKIAFLLAESYQAMHKSPLSIRWYGIAYDNQYGVEALREYAYALKRNQQYEEAMASFKELGLEIGSPYEYRKEITACEQAKTWLKEPDRSFAVSLADFNSNQSDYAPARMGESQIIFTSDRSSATGENTYLWTGKDFSDLFVADLKTHLVLPLEIPAINTERNEGTAAFTPDGKELFFTRCFTSEKRADQYCKLMVARQENGNWVEPVPLPFVKDFINYGHPALSSDGNTLYFSSNDPDGWGGYDLYYTQRGPAGWDDPHLMSRAINTPGNEQFPCFDGDTLYFASDGHPGMGGLDIYKVFPMSNGNWSSPYNLKPPINSGADDFSFCIVNRTLDEEIQLQAYFSSNRDGGMGGDDIYLAEKRKTVEPLPVEPTEPIVYQLFLDVFVLEKIFQDPGNPNSQMLGRKPLAGAQVQYSNNGKLTTQVVGEDGLLSLEIEENRSYQFLATKEGFWNKEATFSSAGLGRDPNNPIQRYELEIVLDQLYADKEIILENIYYDFDRWEIRPDAEPTLNQLARDLQLNPDIRIRMGSHTDCRGTSRYNQELSQRRAQSAVDYLINKGVAADRLQATGFGEEVPAVSCICSECTEAQHQTNRRTTFTIIE